MRGWIFLSFPVPLLLRAQALLLSQQRLFISRFLTDCNNLEGEGEEGEEEGEGAEARRIAADRGEGEEEVAGEEAGTAAAASAAGAAARTGEEEEEEEGEEEDCSTAGVGTCPWQEEEEEEGEEAERNTEAAARIREGEGEEGVAAARIREGEGAVAGSTAVVAVVAAVRTCPWRAVVGEEGERHPSRCQTGQGPRRRGCGP